MAQSVEQLIRNQQVGSSSLPSSSIIKRTTNFFVVLFCLKKRRQNLPSLLRYVKYLCFYVVTCAWRVAINYRAVFNLNVRPRLKTYNHA